MDTKGSERQMPKSMTRTATQRSLGLKRFSSPQRIDNAFFDSGSIRLPLFRGGWFPGAPRD
jgi:hypothetical protein